MTTTFWHALLNRDVWGPKPLRSIRAGIFVTFDFPATNIFAIAVCFTTRAVL